MNKVLQWLTQEIIVYNILIILELNHEYICEMCCWQDRETLNGNLKETNSVAVSIKLIDI